MKEWLDGLPDDPIKDVKYCVYMNRIQQRITRELENFKWLCKNFPDIFLDENIEINNLSGKIVSHRRFKALIRCIMMLNPDMDIELVLKRLEDEKPNFTPIDIEAELKKASSK